MWTCIEMSSDDQLKLTAAKVAIGAAAEVASGLAKTSMPHIVRPGAGMVNVSSNFFNGATKALRSNHKHVSGAPAAGTVAAIHSPVIAAAVIVAAPAVAATALASGAALGIYKLVKWIQDA
jgi:hypothetical protein